MSGGAENLKAAGRGNRGDETRVPRDPRESMLNDRDTRQAIVEAAHELLLERGNAGVKVRSVAARVGVTTGALYGYFSSREDLVSAAYAHALVKSIEQFRISLLRENPSISDHEALHSEVQSALSDDGRAMRMSWLAASLRARHDKDLARAIQAEQTKMLNALADRVREDQADGRVPSHLDPLVVALVTFGSSLGLTSMWPLIGADGEVVDKIADFWKSIDTGWRLVIAHDHDGTGATSDGEHVDGADEGA